jgi:hypothetical protein
VRGHPFPICAKHDTGRPRATPVTPQNSPPLAIDGVAVALSVDYSGKRYRQPPTLIARAAQRVPIDARVRAR